MDCVRFASGFALPLLLPYRGPPHTRTTENRTAIHIFIFTLLLLMVAFLLNHSPTQRSLFLIPFTSFRPPPSRYVSLQCVWVDWIDPLDFFLFPQNSRHVWFLLKIRAHLHHQPVRNVRLLPLNIFSRFCIIYTLCVRLWLKPWRGSGFFREDCHDDLFARRKCSMIIVSWITLPIWKYMYI